MTEPISPAETFRTDRTFQVRVAQRSDVGRVRSENQDFAIATTSEEAADHGWLLLVADGMGGHRGGATASRIAATTVKEAFLDGSNEEIPIILRTALEKANERIFAESQANPDLRGMGTTCSAIVIRDGRAWFAHVGDSRIYLMRGGEIRPLTEDHSLVASMVREGLLTPEEAEVHPRRNVLQRSMGVAGDVEVDVSPEMALEPGDLLVLCSDGLYGLVKEKEIGDILSSSRDIDGAADELVQRALDRGAPDNVTVIVSSIDDAIVFLDGDQDAVPVQTAGPELEQEPDRAEARRTSGMLKWLILGLLVFGATGAAILYWSEGTLLSLLQRIGR